MKTIALTLALALAASTAAAQVPRIYAPDGTYLGDLSSNPYAPNSISNPYGQYGSKYAPNSINNPYGQYGSPYGAQSPNNPFAIQAPAPVSPGLLDFSN